MSPPSLQLCQFSVPENAGPAAELAWYGRPQVLCAVHLAGSERRGFMRASSYHACENATYRFQDRVECG